MNISYITNPFSCGGMRGRFVSGNGILGFLADLCGRVLMARHSDVGSASYDAVIYENRFKEVVRNHEALINKICFYYAATNDEYQDLRQDVMINIWKGLCTFKKESRESTWIYRICMNTCVSGWRRNRKRVGEVPLEAAGYVAEDAGDIEEDIQQLHYLISLLSPSEKALIMLWLDERSYEEISEVTGYNRNTVATKLRRIKNKMRERRDKC